MRLHYANGTRLNSYLRRCVTLRRAPWRPRDRDAGGKFECATLNTCKYRRLAKLLHDEYTAKVSNVRNLHRARQIDGPEAPGYWLAKRVKPSVKWEDNVRSETVELTADTVPYT